MLAEGRTELARTALQRMPEAPARTAWLTYVRCHDDIGWAVSEPDAAAAGLDGQAHREFLAAWYRGDFWQSWARGEPFGTNPATRDERTSGGTAALCGIAAALESGDTEALDRGVARLLLLYGIAFGWGGVPMVYMGDELALPDDVDYHLDPGRAPDSRWRHRLAMDWSAAADRDDPRTLAGRVWAGMTRLVAARRACPPLHAAVTSRPLVAGEGVFGWLRDHPRYGRMLGLAEVAGHHTETTLDPAEMLGSATRPVVDLLADDGNGAPPRRLTPYQVRWLTADTVLSTSPVP